MKAISIILLAAFLTGEVDMAAQGKALDAAPVLPPTDCTFTIKGNFAGTAVDVQITVSDVSWLECTALKLGVKKALK